MSIAGGYFKAAERARAVNCDCVQIFTKNSSQWRAKPISDEEADRFQSALAENNIICPLSHASYLINIASPNAELRKKSIEALIIELERAERLAIPYVVFHPGSCTGCSEQQGIATVISSLDHVLAKTAKLKAYPLLENVAGQGSSLGWDFRQLRDIIQGLRTPERVGICVDTCHTFAAGYSLATPDEFASTINKMSRSFGLKRIKAIHLNDSKCKFGSRVDRHQHIGEGEMGLTPFRLLLNDKRFQKIPMYLETPKGTRNGADLDQVNLTTLRAMVD
jgi:deoxyribonuclease-4